MTKPLVVITAENLASCRIMAPLLERLAPEIALVMLVPNTPVGSGGDLQRLRRMVSRAALSFSAFKAVEIHGHHLLARLRGRTVARMTERTGVPLRRYPSADDPAFIADLQAAAPRYLLSAGPAILGAEVLSAPTEATLNCHCARLPEYRGAANYVWMLVEGESTAWASIQVMELALDEGPLLAERPLAIDPSWSAYRLNFELAGAAGELYAETVERALREGLPDPIERPGAEPRNRGLPKRPAMRSLRARGRRLIRPADPFRCV
ncbi:MAG TPA: formyltransferase family protein [Thermoleophilaceae bacterium]|nr:formyltransferase family protein [Thermoleophilaceae bacterium]